MLVFRDNARIRFSFGEQTECQIATAYLFPFQLRLAVRRGHVPEPPPTGKKYSTFAPGARQLRPKVTTALLQPLTHNVRRSAQRVDAVACNNSFYLAGMQTHFPYSVPLY